MNKTILTFIIPTHNRLFKLKKIIEEILKYPENTIEILISDDSSNNDTKDFIAQIKDNRISYFSRKETSCFLERINKAKGKYVMCLLDKDMVRSKYIGDFIEFLMNNKNVCYGRCLLPFDQSRGGEKYIIYKRGEDGVRALGFREWHPSGFFIDKEKCLKEINHSLLKNAIMHLDAQMAIVGDGAYYQLPMVLTESKRELMKTKTLNSSYGIIDDMFFSIKNECILFRKFIKDLSELPLSDIVKKSIMFEIYFRHLDAVTFRYRNILSDKQICRHYGIRTVEVNNKEIIKNAINFTRNELKYACDLYNLTLKEKFALILKEIHFLLSKINLN